MLLKKIPKLIKLKKFLLALGVYGRKFRRFYKHKPWYTNIKLRLVAYLAWVQRNKELKTEVRTFKFLKRLKPTTSLLKGYYVKRRKYFAYKLRNFTYAIKRRKPELKLCKFSAAAKKRKPRRRPLNLWAFGKKRRRGRSFSVL